MKREQGGKKNNILQTATRYMLLQSPASNSHAIIKTYRNRLVTSVRAERLKRTAQCGTLEIVKLSSPIVA